MKGKFFGAMIIAGVMFFSLNARAADEDAKKDEQKSEAPAVITVRQALTEPGDIKDQRVMLVGNFMGFNGSCKTAMPATRTDIMVQDKQGFCIWVTGPLPRGFDPVSRLGFGEQIVLSGFVVDPDDKPPYFQIPETKKTKQKSGTTTPLFIFQKSKDNRIPKMTLEKAMQTPDKYVGQFIAIKGLYLSDSAACGSPKPVIAQVENPSLWNMKSTNDKCLWILGPVPDGAQAKAEKKTPVTVKGILMKIDDNYYFDSTAPEPADVGGVKEPDKNKVKIEIKEPTQ